MQQLHTYNGNTGVQSGQGGYKYVVFSHIFSPTQRTR